MNKITLFNSFSYAIKMGVKKSVDESFFDRPIITVYVRGIAYITYNPLGNYGVIFESLSRELLDILAVHLKIDQGIGLEKVLDNNIEEPLYRMMIEDVPNLNSSLGGLGLNVPYEKRRFPKDIPKEHISHFVRGFLEASFQFPKNKIILPEDKDKSPQLPIHYNPPFLRELYTTLVENASIKGGRDINESPLLIDLEDLAKLRRYLYCNFAYLRENHLYLPSVLRSLTVIHPSLRGEEINPRVYEIENMLSDGHSLKDITEHFGYTNISVLSRFYKQKTGRTIEKFLRECKVNKGIELLLSGVPLNEVSAKVGYKTTNAFSQACVVVIGKTPKQILNESQSFLSTSNL